MTSHPPEHQPLPKNSTSLSSLGNKITVLIFLFLIVIPALGFAGLFAPGPLKAEKTIIIAHGEGAARIAIQMQKEGAVYLAPFFYIAARLQEGGSLKSGEYAIPPGASATDIADMLHEGKSVIRLFTVAEGLTSAEIVETLNEDPILTGTVAAVPVEGSLLPETYRYSYGDSRAGMIARMQKAMQEKVSEVWASHDSDLPLQSPAQAVALASIVEKETGKPEERPRIAGVFYNRLRINMRLQSDPTVIYALTHGLQPLDRALTHEDLAIASPINTYASDGIPPQPICNPGLAALQAVAHPEHHDFLYFVADGSGGHAFAANLAGQNTNINHWHEALKKNGAHP